MFYDENALEISQQTKKKAKKKRNTHNKNQLYFQTLSNLITEIQALTLWTSLLATYLRIFIEGNTNDSLLLYQDLWQLITGIHRLLAQFG